MLADSYYIHYMMGSARILFFIYFLLNCSKISKCSRILGVFPSPGYSQYILAEPLLITLAERGHNVTVLSAFETSGVKNLQSIKVEMAADNNETDALFKLQDVNIFQNIAFLHELGLDCTKKILCNPRVQMLINSDETFDLVIVETFANEAHFVFAKHFKAHLILFSSIAVSEWNSHLIGSPNQPSYMPTTFSGYTNSMNFYERFRNTMALWYDRYYKYRYQIPLQQALVDEYFHQKYNLVEAMNNASLMLTCSHVSTAESAALVTSVVEVGGLHIKTSKLPDKMQTFLDSATDGAIYFSMGSNLKTTSMAKEAIKEIIDVFGNLKQKIIWKFDDENLNVPKNLMISRWLPQSDILAHPNVIVFISHCGMGSTTETIKFGVPVIGIPIYGDQFMNIKKLVKFGMALKLSYKELSGATLQAAINEIVNNKVYQENAKIRSKIMNDRLVNPLDEAIYWVEYVIRHDGAHHLKSPIRNLHWAQLYMADTILLIIVVPYLLFIFLRRFVRSIL